MAERPEDLVVYGGIGKAADIHVRGDGVCQAVESSGTCAADC